MSETKGNFAPGDWRHAAAEEYHSRRRALMSRRDKSLRTMEGLKASIAKMDAEIAELDQGARVYGFGDPNQAPPLFGSGPGSGASRAVHEGGQFKDVAVAMLWEAYPAPLKATQVQEGAQLRLGQTFHWKTAGMTLYRLSKEHIVRREGHNWFFVPEDQRAALAASAKQSREAWAADSGSILSLNPDPDDDNASLSLEDEFR